jgi:glycerol-3-phosphate cytidylyltransferase
MKTIITYGTFDLTHKGHVNILKRAKENGDYLIVGLSTDEFNFVKNKKSVFSYEHRKTILEAIRYVDLVIPECSWDQKRTDILKYNVNTFVMGHDWTNKFNDLQDMCDVVYLPRTEGISTSMLKEILRQDNTTYESQVSYLVA